MIGERILFFLSMSMALLFAWNFRRGIRTGYVGTPYSGVRRHNDPILFWISMMVSGAGALFMTALLGVSIWKLLS